MSEDTLNEILPKAFAVVKETAKRFVENKEVIVEANDNDIELSSRKDYIQVKITNLTGKILGMLQVKT